MAKRELTQAQRDQKNERLRLARAAAKKVSPIPVGIPVLPPAARKPGSGGARPNTGFQKLPIEDKMVIISFRGTPAQKKKFAKLGGGAWVRARIDAGTVKA